MIYTDCHLHTNLSGDGEASMEDMIRGAITLGLKTICFTEHHDPDYPTEDFIFTVDTAHYTKMLFDLKEKYRDRIEVLYGIEFGMQAHLVDMFHDYIRQWPFDFIIGSSHVVYGIDPFYSYHVQDIDDRKLYRDYLEEVLQNIKRFDGFQSYGHLDYIVRYGAHRTKYYNIPDYLDIIDELLKTAISKGIGIEVNTAGLKHQLGFPHPHPDILKRYRELGGEIITIGSDAHRPEHIAYGFREAADLLKACGFSYYTIFRNRKPEFLPID